MWSSWAKASCSDQGMEWESAEGVGRGIGVMAWTDQEELRPQGTKEMEKADDFCSSFNLEWE